MMMSPHLVQQSGKLILGVASVGVIVFLALPLQLKDTGGGIKVDL